MAQGRQKMPLDARVARAAEQALAAESQVSVLDVLIGIGWLDPGAVKRWRLGQLDCIEAEAQVAPARLAEARALLRDWAAANRLVASETDYVARTPERQPLSFSARGDPAVERDDRTHWISAALPERRRARIAEKASRPPELVVVSPLKNDWTCHRCGSREGGLLIMEGPGPACLGCAGLADLAWLPAGDAALTRRAKAASARHAVVVRFSRTRRRYERQGLLVEPEALAAADRSLGGGRVPEDEG